MFFPEKLRPNWIEKAKRYIFWYPTRNLAQNWILIPPPLTFLGLSEKICPKWIQKVDEKHRFWHLFQSFAKNWILTPPSSLNFLKKSYKFWYYARKVNFHSLRARTPPWNLSKKCRRNWIQKAGEKHIFWHPTRNFTENWILDPLPGLEIWG